MPDAPPILQFTLRVLESLDVGALAEVCAGDLVDLFGARWAAVELGDEEVARAGKVGPGVEFSFALAPPGEPRARLRVGIDRGPDVPIMRQQYLDLVAVIRRAWAHALVLARTSKRAREDELTGLDNRRGVEEHLDRLAQRSAHTGDPLAVMLVDLDHFKRVNDEHGHAAGDAVLQLAAEVFRAHLRSEDRICRWGGDEFLIILSGMSGPGAVGVAERLRIGFASHTAARGATMTIGIADVESLTTPTTSAQALLERADSCLYAAKRAGRNCTCVAPPARFVA